MQFKKDMDFALRILLTMAEENKVNDLARKPFTVGELHKKTGIPRQIIIRIGKKLTDAGFIIYSVRDKGILFYPSGNICSRTMFDVIRAIEENTDLYALFDQNHCVWLSSKAAFMEIEASIHESLKRMTIAALLKSGHEAL